MHLFKSSIIALSLTAILAACAGQAQVQSNVGFSSQAQPGGSAKLNSGAFPQECYVDNQLAMLKEEPSCYGTGTGKYCSEHSVLCTCVGKSSIARWARLKSPDNGNDQYGYCKYLAPEPSQVDRMPIGVPDAGASASAAVPPPPVPVASASASAIASASSVPPAAVPPVDPRQSQSSPTCETKDGVVTCKTITANVSDGGSHEATFHCVGPNVVPLGVNDLAKYQGGAPCTCSKGKLKPVASAQNTWMCETGK